MYEGVVRVKIGTMSGWVRVQGSFLLSAYHAHHISLRVGSTTTLDEIQVWWALRGGWCGV